MTEIDLTPAEPTPTGKRSLRNWVIVAAIVGTLGFVLFQALTSARVYYLNVDEAVEQKADLVDETFRMQGVVVTEPETSASGALVFGVSFNDVDAQIVHIGEEPTDLFELGQNVVIEGRWDGDRFTSNQILVKHSESYVADNEDRPGVGSPE